MQTRRNESASRNEKTRGKHITNLHRSMYSVGRKLRDFKHYMVSDASVLLYKYKAGDGSNRYSANFKFGIRMYRLRNCYGKSLRLTNVLKALLLGAPFLLRTRMELLSLHRTAECYTEAPCFILNIQRFFQSLRNSPYFHIKFKKWHIAILAYYYAHFYRNTT